MAKKKKRRCGSDRTDRMKALLEIVPTISNKDYVALIECERNHEQPPPELEASLDEAIARACAVIKAHELAGGPKRYDRRR